MDWGRWKEIRVPLHGQGVALSRQVRPLKSFLTCPFPSPPPETLSGTDRRTVITIAIVLVIIAVIVGGLGFCCVRQRRHRGESLPQIIIS
jgi:hypothetical protein